MRISLQHKLLGAFVAAVLIVLIAIAAGLPPLIRTYFITSKQHELTTKGNELVQVVNDYYDGQISQPQLYSFVNRIDSFLDSRVWVVDKDLNLITVSEEQPNADFSGPPKPIKESPMHHFMPLGPGNAPGSLHEQHMQNMMRNHRNLPEQNKPSAFTNSQTPTALSDITGMDAIIDLIKLNSGRTWSLTYYHPYYEENMLIVGIPLLRANGTLSGTVMINTPIAEIDHFLTRIYLYLLIASLAACLIATVLANFLSGHIIGPLKNMQRTAAAMAAGDYQSKIPLLPNDEIGDLGKSFNALGQALTAFVAQTERIDKTRRDFVANISHELRTPLTIIRGYNEALLDGTVTDAALTSRYHQIISNETVRLERLIAELLDLSQLQSDHLEWNLEPVSLTEIVNNVLLLMEQRSQEAAVKLKSFIPAALPAILAEGDRITQLVLILVDNAVKFSPTGGEVTVSLTQEKAGLLLTVQDTGKGISPEDLPYIWERFYKGDKARTRSAGGTGLGLAIAKAILDRHHATATVTSSLGQGTTFTILFP